jgi:DNA-binding NtrC family response regulator
LSINSFFNSYFQTSSYHQGAVKAIVRTANVEEAIAQVGEAYDARQPVLLQGEIGSGKLSVSIANF